jgi:hypothetical protein
MSVAAHAPMVVEVACGPSEIHVRQGCSQCGHFSFTASAHGLLLERPRLCLHAHCCQYHVQPSVGNY